MTSSRRRHSVLVPAAIAVGLLLEACSSDTRNDLEDDARTAISDAGEAIDETARDAAEALARTIATEQGEEQFRSEGHPINGKLTCEATADELDAIDITCTGTTDDGGAARLTGTTSELPGASVATLHGDFTGTVDGDEVFSTTRLGG
jgi:hypothetical protein